VLKDGTPLASFATTGDHDPQAIADEYQVALRSAPELVK
jgi:hypothetical protein